MTASPKFASEDVIVVERGNDESISRWLAPDQVRGWIDDYSMGLLGDTAASGVTTLIDYYGLPDDVPGMSTHPSGPARARVEHVERAIAGTFNDRDFALT